MMANDGGRSRQRVGGGYPGEGTWGDRDYPGGDLQFSPQSGGWAEWPPYGRSNVRPGPAGPEFAGQGVYGDEMSWQPDPAVGQPSYRGVGPRGYRRSDERLREEIHARLTDDPFLDPSDVVVRVQDGVVTLDGRVPGRAMKRRAEDDLESVRGVLDIRNQLTTD